MVRHGRQPGRERTRDLALPPRRRALSDARDLGPDAQRAVETARAEAAELGHDRVGTEHLLLGLLAHAGTGAAQLLRDSGAKLPAARHKVREVHGPPPRRPARDEPLPTTARADRALARAVRFAHARKADAVTTEHLLLGVLDVEGTAGQVLRGLGVDVDRVRVSLEHDREPVAPAPPAPDQRAAPPRLTCPSCRGALDLVCHTVTAREAGEGGRPAVVFACGACGHVIGAAPG